MAGICPSVFSEPMSVSVRGHPLSDAFALDIAVSRFPVGPPLTDREEPDGGRSRFFVFGRDDRYRKGRPRAPWTPILLRLRAPFQARLRRFANHPLPPFNLSRSGMGGA